MALHAKVGALAGLSPDIAIIAECAKPETVTKKNPTFRPTSSEWVGDYPHKGLGVFSFGQWRIARSPDFEPTIRFAIPLVVSGPESFHLLALWACYPQKRGSRYTFKGPSRDAVERYGAFLRAAPSVIVGDLNNNVKWDKPGAAANHSVFVDMIDRDLDLVSAYHTHSGHPQGDEPHKTLFWMKGKANEYHIDYCFVPRRWTDRLGEVTVGGRNEWLSISDHAPLSVMVSGS